MSDDGPKYEIQLEDGVARLPQAQWDAVVGDGSPFLEWAFLASLEDAKTLDRESGWLSKPLVARENGRIVAACPLYLKTHSEGEFVFDFSWAEAAERAGIDYYPKLLVGVPFSPVSGARFLVHPSADRKRWIERLAGALREICDSNNLSSVHVNFCLPDEAEVLQRLGFDSRIGLQYHWQNRGYRDFEDYLAAFRSNRRNQIRRERREMEKQGVAIETIAGDDITSDLVEPMYQFYLSTIRSRAWGREYLNRAVFELLIERFRDRLVFVIAKQYGERIGGTFNVQKGDALFGRYWGAIRSVRHLHFNVCYYASVEYCIDRGLARFEPGAGGEYKQMRGFDACPTYSAHYVADPRLSAAIEHFLEAERSQARSTIDWVREHSALIKRTPGEPKD
ncbi:MAG: GNAT family N-acetyltransferase [Myxococcota bacterium]